ncbi:hypothetical protein EYF80_013774 [Liparis tanakae]|uniref:Uncharacterized protein n=1 Tax=Liparis tanakae TaxID=230148 RepID=A0A4Z2IE30_9TELE|nr:hypothetical protein EYF80_013774 [Liparis tanakae]
MYQRHTGVRGGCACYCAAGSSGLISFRFSGTAPDSTTSEQIAEGLSELAVLHQQEVAQRLKVPLHPQLHEEVVHHRLVHQRHTEDEKGGGEQDQDKKIRHSLCDERGGDGLFDQDWQGNHLAELDGGGVHGKSPRAPSYLLQQLTLGGRRCARGKMTGVFAE